MIGARLLELARRAVEIGWASLLVKRHIRRGPRHGLDRELIVSLTSYPPRFSTLHLTLRSLLNQSVSPDRLIVWIAHGDAIQLPQAVCGLEAIGVEIRLCDDLRSFKKIVPALEQFPDAYVVTADDDLYYRRNWLEGLVKAAMPTTNDIVAHTVRRPTYVDGAFATIWNWDMNAVDAATQLPSDDIYPCTGAGALYPPRSLHPDAVDRDQFERLCPTCDDSWLAWMARRNGTLVRRSGTRRWTRLIAWQGTNAGSLSASNFATSRAVLQQDEINRRLADHFGPLNSLLPDRADGWDRS